MDEGKRGSKPRGQNVYVLDEKSAGEREGNPRANTRGHEQILQPASDTTADIEIGDMVMLNAKKC